MSSRISTSHLYPMKGRICELTLKWRAATMSDPSKSDFFSTRTGDTVQFKTVSGRIVEARLAKSMPYQGFSITNTETGKEVKVYPCSTPKDLAKQLELAQGSLL